MLAPRNKPSFDGKEALVCKDRIISTYLADFVKEFGLGDLEQPKAFEHFVNYCVVSRHHSDTFDPEDVTVGGGGDLGLDGVAILVNDHLVRSPQDVDYFKKALRRLDVDFVFVQAKMSPRFEATDIGNFVFGVRQFFAEALPAGTNESVVELHGVKEHIFDSSIDMDRSPGCRLYYATIGSWQDDPALRNRIEQGTTDLKQTGLFSSVEFTPVDAEGLKRLHRELHHKITREILFEKHAILPQVEGVQEAYIGIVPCLEYLKLIRDQEGVLNRKLFYDNVRDFQGHNPVNLEIEATVRDAQRNDRFALLNNGVTVVAREVNKVGASFRLRDFQIVNGCQTSHILHLNREHLTDRVYLPLKLIVTTDPEVINQIIQGTNRQTEVKLEAFESLAPFQRKLEEFYGAMGQDALDPLYYERRSKQYDHLEVRRDRIITLATQIKCFVAMFLNEPHSTHRYYGEILTSYKSRLFGDTHSPMPYFTSGAALASVERLFYRGRLPREWKPRKYQMLMVFRIQNEPFDLPFLNSRDIDKYCQALLDVLADDHSCEDSFRRAGELVQSVRPALISGREPPERTRAFTKSLLEQAGQSNARTATTSRISGTVKMFSDIRGWGFIQGDDGVDYFVHYSGIRGRGYRSLSEGQRVKFTSLETHRGIQANDVEVT
jgi:cold shock CspA family protein